MNGQQWEFCYLHLFDHEEVKGKGWKYDLHIHYMNAETEITNVLSEKGSKNAKVWTYNPFRRAIGVLGSSGWELISVQHANWSGAYRNDCWTSNYDIDAYFKRPVKQGRRVDEPKLVLP